MTPGSILSQSQAFSTESNQSQSSIHVNIMAPGVKVNFFLGHPVSRSKKLLAFYGLSTQYPSHLSLTWEEKRWSFRKIHQSCHGVSYHLQQQSGALVNCSKLNHD